MRPTTFYVVGESHYQADLRELCGGDKDGARDLDFEADLVPEASNPHDANAVEVLVEGRRVGYLSRPDAAQYRAIKGVQSTRCIALVNGGWDHGEQDRGAYGVRVEAML